MALSRLLRLTGRAISPISTRIPIGSRTIAVLTHSGFMLPVPDPALAARAVGEFLSTPVEWFFHLALRSSEHARVSLSRVKVPVMFVAATYDVLAGARDMRSAADRLEDATYVELRGSHFIQMEQPEAVHDLLRRLPRRRRRSHSRLRTRLGCPRAGSTWHRLPDGPGQFLEGDP